MVTFDLPLSALLQCLLLRAVRSLLLMRSLTDATELYTRMELHISACCPNQAEPKKSIKETACLPFKQWFYC